MKILTQPNVPTTEYRSTDSNRWQWCWQRLTPVIEEYVKPIFTSLEKVGVGVGLFFMSPNIFAMGYMTGSIIWPEKLNKSYEKIVSLLENKTTGYMAISIATIAYISMPRLIVSASFFFGGCFGAKTYEKANNLEKLELGLEGNQLGQGRSKAELRDKIKFLFLCFIGIKVCQTVPTIFTLAGTAIGFCWNDGMNKSIDKIALLSRWTWQRWSRTVATAVMIILCASTSSVAAAFFFSGSLGSLGSWAFEKLTN